MTDRYADLRAALAAGPTPGPWDYGADPCLNNEAALAICKQNIDAHAKPSSGYFFVVYVGDGRRTALVGHGPDGEANARLIAACHPEAIRALLAERDDVLENGKQAVRWAPSSAYWSNELKRLFGEDAREGIDALEAQLRAAQAERDELRKFVEAKMHHLPVEDQYAASILVAALAQEGS